MLRVIDNETTVRIWVTSPPRGRVAEALADQTRPDYVQGVKLLNISEAKAQLSAVVKRVVEDGEEVIIGKAGHPLVKIVRYERRVPNRRLGLFRGQAKVADDFDAWPDDIAKNLGIAD